MADLHLECITDHGALESLQDEWRGVWRASSDRSPFLTWEWVTNWWRHFGAGDRLEVLLAKDGDAVIGIAPLLQTRVGIAAASQTMMVGIGQENADYGGFLLGERPAETGVLFVDHLAKAVLSGAVSVNLTRLRPEGDLLPIVHEAVRRYDDKLWLVEEQRTAYPYLDLAAVDDQEAYVQKMDTRNDVRRRTRRLAERHELDFEYDADPDQRNLRALFDLSSSRWSTKEGKMAGVFASDDGRRFVTDVAAAMRAAGDARLSLLSADDVVIAARFGFECDGAYLGYKECFDPAFSKFGPGQMLTSRILHLEIERGMREFDFLRGEGEHKAVWVNAERTVGYWTLHRSGAVGRLRRKLMWNQLRLRVRRWSR